MAAGPLRVAMVTARYHPLTGGVETHVHELATRLAARGFEVTVITTDPTGRLPARERRDRLTVLRCPSWPSLGDLAWAPGLPGALRGGAWDVVHVQGVHTLVAPMALAALRGRGLPLIVTFHSGGHSSRMRGAIRPLQWRLLRPLLRQAVGLIAVSEFEATRFGRVLGLPRGRFTVIPNGFELPATAAADCVGGKPLVVSVGRLERYKGHHRVIRAMETVLRAHPEAELCVVGTGPYEERLRRLARSGAAESHVRFVSFAAGERAALGGLLARADLVTLLSEYEAHPVAAMEAAGLGRRLLVADNSGLRELAERGLAHAVSLRRSDQAIGEAMLRMLRQPPPTAPAPPPGWDACADRHVELYQSALAGAEAVRR